MSDHLAVLEELANKWRSEFTGGDDRELKEIGYDACLLDCADELEAAIALMRGQPEPVGYIGAHVAVMLGRGYSCTTTITTHVAMPDDVGVYFKQERDDA